MKLMAQKTTNVRLFGGPRRPKAAAKSRTQRALPPALTQQRPLVPLASSRYLGTPRRNGQSGQTAGGSRGSRQGYGWFTEGFDTRDLNEGGALLGEVAA
jgi:hypothetical protein